MPTLSAVVRGGACLWLGAWSLGCHRPRAPAQVAPPSAVAPQPPAPTAALKTKQAVDTDQAVGPMALGAMPVRCPSCSDARSDAAREFCEAATRAVRRAYDDDSEDTSLLISLLNAAEVHTELAAEAERWRPLLHNALGRGQLLHRAAAGLRRLRGALADAYCDPRTHLYSGIDTAKCQQAFVYLRQETDVPMDLVVTIEPLGSYPLSRFWRLCSRDRRLGAPHPPRSLP